MNQPQVIFCNRCGEQNPTQSRFCEACGDPFDCPFCSCGAELVPKANFCHMCGSRVFVADLSKTTPEHEISQPPKEEPSAKLLSQGAELAKQLKELHANLIETHHKTAACLQEEKRLKGLFEDSARKAGAFREKASEFAKLGKQDDARRSLEQQLVHEREAAEHRAHSDLNKVSSELLRGELFHLHNQFLEFIDVSLERFAQLRSWAPADEALRACLAVEVSNSRKARILYALGIIARDGLNKKEQARLSFEQSAAADPKLSQAKEALKNL
jgi:hypothetical protein